MSCEVRVIFFAKARELVGASEGSLLLPPEVTYRVLKAALLDEYSALKRIEKSFIVAVNQEYVGEEDECCIRVHPGDEVAVIPPISGG